MSKTNSITRKDTILAKNSEVLTASMLPSSEQMTISSLINNEASIIDINSTILIKELVELNEIMFDNANKQIQTVDYNDIKHFGITTIQEFCRLNGVYVIPTFQLCDWLVDKIGEDNLKSTIEIGAGIGAIGRDLGIRLTDSKVQSIPEVRKLYLASGQPVITYPNDIIHMDAESALKKLRPKFVIGCYITRKYRVSEHALGGSIYGVDEAKLVRNCMKYFMVGSKHVHDKRTALTRNPNIHVIKHENIPGVIDRSMKNDTVIYECTWR